MSKQISGVVVAVVTDTGDPTNRHRVQIRIASKSSVSSAWARAVGSCHLGVGDEVLVAFEEGDVRQPFVIGALSNNSPSTTADDPGVIRLPTGSTLKGFDNSCDHRNVKNVLQQLSSYLAAVECQNKILLLMKPLIEVINEFPSPSPGTLAQFSAAATDLVPCLEVTLPARMVPFVRDLLCVTLKSLELLIDARISQADRSAAIVSIQGVLDLAEPYFDAVGVLPIKLATTGDEADLTLDISVLRSTTDALGGC